MKNAAILLFVAAALCMGGCATTQSGAVRKKGSDKRGEKMVVRTTAYTPNERGGGGSHNACGQLLHFGGESCSAASDWSWLPLGTRFRMEETGRTYVIEDYGSALVGKKTIDLYMPTRAGVREWGVRMVHIEILEMGSRVMSLRLLEPRQKTGYVRKMVEGLRRSGSGDAHLVSTN